MQTPESKEKAKIDAFGKTLDIYAVKIATFGYGESGHPDRIWCWRGRFIAIEVKRPGKEPTPIQWRRIKEVRDHGGVAFYGTAEKVIPEIQAFIAAH